MKFLKLPPLSNCKYDFVFLASEFQLIITNPFFSLLLTLYQGNIFYPSQNEFLVLLLDLFVVWKCFQLDLV